MPRQRRLYHSGLSGYGSNTGGETETQAKLPTHTLSPLLDSLLNQPSQGSELVVLSVFGFLFVRGMVNFFSPIGLLISMNFVRYTVHHIYVLGALHYVLFFNQPALEQRKSGNIIMPSLPICPIYFVRYDRLEHIKFGIHFLFQICKY